MQEELPHLPKSDSDCDEAVASGGTKPGASSFIFFGALGLQLGGRALSEANIDDTARLMGQWTDISRIVACTNV